MDDVWLEDAVAAVQSYRDLPENWDSYGADTINDATIRLAEEVLALLYVSGWARPKLAPSPSGAIAIWWGDEERTIEVYAMAIQNEIFSRNEVREMENRNPVPGGDEFRNPITVPQGKESTMDDEDSSRAARLYGALCEGAARRISKRELDWVSPRVKHIHKDRQLFNEKVGEFYQDHAGYIDREIGPLCDAIGAREMDRAAWVEEVTTENIRELLAGDPERVVMTWADGELCARYIRKLKGLAA